MHLVIPVTIATAMARNAPEVFLCTERPEETDCDFFHTFRSVKCVIYIGGGGLGVLSQANFWLKRC